MLTPAPPNASPSSARIPGLSSSSILEFRRVLFRSLPLVSPHQLRDGNGSAGECLLELGSSGARLELERVLERVEPEEVAVRAVTGRRAGPAIAGRAKVVAALDGRGLTFAQPACRGLEPPGQPVSEGPAGRVRVIEDQSERRCAVRHARPGEWRREILPLAAVPARDRLPVRKRAARQLHQSCARSTTSARVSLRRSAVGIRTDRSCEPASRTTLSRSASLESTSTRSLLPPNGGTAPSSKSG